MIILTRSDPSRNMHRFYAMHLAPAPFGERAFIAEGLRADFRNYRTQAGSAILIDESS